MPNMPLNHKVKMFSHYALSGRAREIYNMFWVYPLWWNRKTAYYILNKFLPKIGVDLYPPFLEIEPTTICNYKCVMCEHTYWDEKNKSISFENFKKIFDSFGKPKWLGLTGIGSSYFNKDYHKMLAYAKSKGTLIEVFDHFGHFKNDDQIRELIETGMDYQFISIYGANKETYEKVCVGSNYTEIEQNIRKFVKFKKEMKARFPILSFHYIVTKDSRDEIMEFLEFVKSLNTEIGEILVTPMLHGFKEAEDFITHIDEDYVKMVRREAGKLGVPVTINMAHKKEAEGLDKKPDINHCKEYLMPFFFSNGDVTPCCAQNESNQREWQHRTSPGNAIDTPFKKIWNSKKYKNIRKMIRQNKTPFECTYCPAYDISDLKGKRNPTVIPKTPKVETTTPVAT